MNLHGSWENYTPGGYRGEGVPPQGLGNRDWGLEKHQVYGDRSWDDYAPGWGNFLLRGAISLGMRMG